MVLKKEERERRAADIRVLSDEEFASKYSITYESAQRFRRKCGILRPRWTLVEEISEEDKQHVCEMYQAKYYIKQICAETGFSLYTVNEILWSKGFNVAHYVRNNEPIEITPETVTPFFYRRRKYEGELNEPEKTRYEELRKWKEEAYFRKLNNSEFCGQTT